MSFIDGLSSGLNTTAIIDALLAVERLPQRRLIDRRTRSQNAADQLGKLRTDVTNLRNTAADLKLASGWNRLTATSSSDAVRVTAGSGQVNGSISFRVDSLATNHVVYSNDVIASLDEVVGAGGTLSQVVEAINRDDTLNFKAMAVNTGSGYRLQLSAKEGGAAGSITLDDSLFGDISGFTTLTEGADAQITFTGLNPYSITSSTNTFTGLMPGVDVTVSQTTTDPVTVTVAKDHAAVADAVEALVKQFNELKSKLAAATKVDPGIKTQVPLAFNGNVRRAEQSLLRAMTNPVAASSFDAPSLAGISLQRDGTLQFDRQRFLDAAATDLDELTKLFTTSATGGEGILDRLITAADEATTFGTGLLSSAQESEKSRIESFTRQIDAYESRLDRKETQLRKLYSNLEVALGNLNDQSNWLGSQLNSLTRQQ